MSTYIGSNPALRG